ncbi:hypothetical protein ASPBRDRAFT_201508 [Aspergillus brasiliensis CBS 101740]|uniref:Uncharacterized protein n=1 Tax=Aspergillus brasiliensis (strain CBS 101740 / IMI 381727 / IBT 21946) TaxID=767769 RepID=A0A1L9U2G4_ASPBC|nr:hypothetical protein ASPBRDRAFT_201508 [Aspergillus brasiliensis CBS 101740]
MHISFDSISFYHPPPPKLQTTVSASRWKLYKAPPAPHSLSHPLPPKPPILIANIPISGKQPTAVQQSRNPTEDEASAAPAFRNAFDVELERVSREYLWRETTQLRVRQIWKYTVVVGSQVKTHQMYPNVRYHIQ